MRHLCPVKPLKKSSDQSTEGNDGSSIALARRLQWLWWALMGMFGYACLLSCRVICLRPCHRSSLLAEFRCSVIAAWHGMAWHGVNTTGGRASESKQRAKSKEQRAWRGGRGGEDGGRKAEPLLKNGGVNRRNPADEVRSSIQHSTFTTKMNRESESRKTW